MININEIFNHLISLDSENEVVEFKEAKTQYDFNKLGKYFSALSNEANLANKDCAWLVFGVKDSDKSLVNTNFRKNKTDLHNLKSEIANHTGNRITFIEIHELYRDNKRVILFQIPAAPKGLPISWKNHYYGRDHSEINGLNIQEIERIRAQIVQNDWSSKIIENATINDLSENAILKAKESYKTKNSHLIQEIDSWDNITFLNKAKVCIKGKITNTAILILGKPESEYLIKPATAKLTWILRDRDNIEKDYFHFSCPLILSVEQLYNKIRNLKFRYLQEGSLFPDEVDMYDPYIIREAINNCIAHQDYSLGGKINVVEYEDSNLVFSNAGQFIPQSIEHVINSDAPELIYRNSFLANAMVNLNMIDTIGSGIKKMFYIQKNKFFPLPEYDLSNQKVKVTITGKVIDQKYAKKLAQNKHLTLSEIILLDKVQKNKPLTEDEIKLLKKQKHIEGRKPNFYISSNIAKKTEQKADYIKQRGIDDGYCQKIIIDYLKKFNSAKKADFEKILLEKLPDVLDENQKKTKIKNNLQKLRKDDIIYVNGKIWYLKEMDK